MKKHPAAMVAAVAREAEAVLAVAKLAVALVVAVLARELVPVVAGPRCLLEPVRVPELVRVLAEAPLEPWRGRAGRRARLV
jgi:hypothetical protein